MSAARARRWLFAAVVFASAFLLFLVEPLAAKALLPAFGGSAAVWLAALVFFQVALVAGYLWAHLLATRLRPRAQAIAQVALLVAAGACLPIAAPERVAASLPELALPMRVLLTLVATVGIPYTALAATGPLLQTFWARTEGGAPYRLYALSNVASLLGLLFYPFVLEPRVGLAAQRMVWSAGFGLFALLCAAAATASARAPAQAEPHGPAAPATTSPPSRGDRVLWLVLPFAASLLLSAVTGHLTLNVAPVPLLWVVPLAAYLLSFVLTFESDRLYRRAVWIPCAVVALAFLGHRTGVQFNGRRIAVEVGLEVLAFFVCAVVCHGELIRLRPGARWLTPFYVWLAVGGAAGGAFVALLAPVMFRTDLDLSAGLLVCALVIAAVLWRSPRLRPAGTAVIAAGSAAGVAFLAWTLYSHERAKRARCVDFARSFYSSLRIEEESFPERSNAVFRSLVHGTTIHGGQWRDPEHQREPTSYYGRSSGVGRAIEGLRRRGEPLRVGVVGLGAGVLAAYCNPGDSFTFFEIDPLVERIATSRFSFLAGCGGREVVQGDARLSLARPRDGFGLLAVDAFSGDAIPVHLLTIEAFQTFAARLAPGGILAMHVSNRFVDLAPVVAASAARIGWSSFQVEENADEERGVYANTWVLVVADRARMADLALGGLSPLVPPAGFRAWTDDFSHLAGLLHDVRTSKDDDEEEGEE